MILEPFACSLEAGSMQTPSFIQLNQGWNADPNGPLPEVSVDGSSLRLRFYLNHFAHDAVAGEEGQLTFQECSAWRLGAENDHAWYAGRCRYSGIAPRWGEFYELIGPDDLRLRPDDWRRPMRSGGGERHFLFYLRDDLFECLADDWRFDRGLGGEQGSG